MDASSRQKHPARRLKSALNECMIQSESSSKCIVPRVAIDACWQGDLGQLREKLGLYSWIGPYNEDLLSVLRDKFYIVASILAWIEYENFSDRLRVFCSSIQNQSEHRHEVTIRDSDLFVTLEKCREALGHHEGRDFYNNQFVFLPNEIGSGSNGVRKVHPQSRWPWRPLTKESIGSGASGKVSKVDIVKGQLRPFNDKDVTIAYKRIRGSNDWLKEVSNLNLLQSSLLTHEHITLHLEALVRGSKFYIFSPYTPLGDLEVFLREGTRLDEYSVSRTIYTFSDQFPNFEALDLIKQCSCIISAAAFLHGDMFKDENTLLYCVHADLRPQNILVFPGDPQRNPVGIWRISDFGISSFKSEDHRTSYGLMSLQYLSVGDVFRETRGVTNSLSTSLRPPGTYVGPERHFERFSQLRESDVWSLGCIFLEVLVFSVGSKSKDDRAKKLDIFRKGRYKMQGPNADHNDYFYDVESSEQSSSATGDFPVTFKRRERVDETLRYLSIKFSPLVRDLAHVVHRMLQLKPASRINANSAYSSIHKVCNRHSQNVSSAQRNRHVSTGDFDVSEVRAEEWKVLATRASDEHSSGFLVFKDELSSSIEDLLIVRESTEHSHAMELDESASPQARARELDQSSSSHISEIRIPGSNFHFESSSKLIKAVLKVEVSNSVGTIVYLCKRYESHGSFSGWSLSRSSSSSNSKPMNELRFRKPWQTTSSFEADKSPAHVLPESGNIDWQGLRVDGQYAIVTGTHLESGSKRVHIYDFVDGQVIDLPQDGPATSMHKVVASVYGSFAAYDDMRLVTWRLGEHWSIQDVSPPFGASGQAVFGSSGDFLFTWSCRHKKDVLKIWKRDSLDRPQIGATLYVPRPRDHAPSDMFLIPCGSSSACVIRDGRGKWYTASLHSDSTLENKEVVKQEFPGSDLPDKRSLYTATERHLFFISTNQEICVCDLTWNIHTTLILNRQPRPLLKLKTKWPESIELYHSRAGKNELVICELSGAMENIEIEY